ncbi:carboxylating nicotinate-nucleotide diphosphorylase [Halanaerobium sp. Z-7514]|uniref:Probable nicotinate-nucleotide pyrophosphorylase [carboxylating] n=1 Tax=Halanaerobium polyolivorans TaxID=2886943 RepID=A0AAW4X0B3_9FIRM|nr:carboxylating nicotinate-nucleotide diphosphorylase [Halanaerobium polyolivorans]MCC3145251.1 carboxylating nicotinate-nucleotide diphosphorylase [Halanaerobium polyolivorans]RQD76780.1 MAG: carboxylating nicotinate-nucleotide diphosphorylase [Halanaerobium sp. MSAO_Bac5]
MLLNKFTLNDIIERAIQEDLGYGDLTTDNLIAASASSKAQITSKEEGVTAGLEIARAVFHQYDPDLKFKALQKEGDKLQAGTVIAEVEGSTRSILKAERLALNFLQRLSGIATKSREYVELVEAYPAQIADTRKTTPTLRMLEKYAVKVGGAKNHRMGLDDCVMIKDNHLKAAGSIKKAVKKIKANISHTTKIEIEIDQLPLLEEALAAEVDIILLDNMSPEELKKAVQIVDGRVILEASGGITKENVAAIAASGVDIISVGALTHQINSIDIALDLE